MEELYVLDEEINEDIIKVYLEDSFFNELDDYLKNEDYALAKDAIKGLYNLAGKLSLYRLYELLIDVYEDLEYEEYSSVYGHYLVMMEEYRKLLDKYHI